MNKTTLAAVLSLAGLGLSVGDAFAGGCCSSHHCTKKFKVVCSQYNAFSPFCCIPVAHGFRKHGCCAPNLIMPYYQMPAPCHAHCGPAAADCPGGNCGPQAGAAPGANPAAQAMQAPLPPGYGYPMPPMHPMMAQQGYPMPPMHPMMAQGMPMPPMMGPGMVPPMHPMMGQGYPPMGLVPPQRQGYPVGYYPPPNQALIAPPGTMGMPPTGFPTDAPAPSN
jgi:hypothetical protein